MDPIYQIIALLAQHHFLPAAFEYPFMSRALLAALLAGPMLGGLGTWVVSQRWVFFSQTICHASLTGVAIGLYFGEPVDETYGGLFGFTLLAALSLLFLRHRTGMATDTITGVILAQVLGLGIVSLVLVTQQFNIHQVEAILFGSLITVSERDVYLLMGVFLLFLIAVFFFYNQAMLIGFNAILAKAQGVYVITMEYLIVVILTLVIVASLKIIGALLVLALLVIPPASAQNLFSNLTAFFWFSVLVATLSSTGGLVVSATWSLPSGSAIVLVASVFFCLSLILRPLLQRSATVYGDR